jgi:dipeptidyl aminopeptidase/acylaminoacyl peptidase
MTDIKRPTGEGAATAPVEAPCGSWSSAVSVALVAGKTIGLSTLRADGGALLWLESRPAEAGRTVLRRLGEAGPPEDLTPAPFNVGSRVHEYGGGAYVASGGRICFSHRPDDSLWLIEPGQAPRPVCTVSALRFADLCFAPGGESLIAVREDHRGTGAPEAAIVALPLDPRVDASVNTGEVLVRGPDFLSSPRVSPDGRRLVWIAWDHPNMPWDATRLHGATLGRDAQGRITLADERCLAGKGRDEALMQPLFDAQGVLHVCSDRNGWWNLYRLSADGALAPVCPTEREIGLPPWVFGQRSYGFLPDGSIVASAIEQGRVQTLHIVDGTARVLPIGSAAECPVVLARADGPFLGWLRATPDEAAAVVMAPFGQDRPARVVVSAHPLALSPGDIAVAEAIRFPTPDGAVGHAFYYAPTNARFVVPRGERPPLVVMAHGGPTGMTSDALSLRVQWWTSRGIGVVDVNYGGSTGFGRAFRRRLDGQWGVVDVDDCIAACTHLVETGRADPARIAIRGSSAGGFTVLAALTRSTLFSAAACLYGIGELRSLAEETHKFEGRYLDRLVGRLPEDAAIYDARSPIRHLDALRCPVIFFHGLDDKVVPVAQTRLMAQAMHARGIQVEVHEFENEAHGFRREETIRQVLQLELAFYGSLFGFRPAADLPEE